jgi:serine/threonine protein kinase
MPDWTGKELESFKILEKCKEDALITTYKSFDTHLDREVYLAVLLAENNMGSEFIDHFRHEALTIARLDHPNILAIYDYGVEEGVPYLVQEPSPSKTLKDLPPIAMPWKKAVKFLLPIADALRYANSKMVIHQDIRPSNITIDEQDFLKLTGFGIVQMLEGVEGLPLTGIGDPEYQSPEHGKGETLDQRTDIYSFGIILYQLVTGRVPFQADTPFAVTLKHISEPVPPPHQFAPGLPDLVENAILKALNKQATDRYQDMESFIACLNELLATNGQGMTPIPVEDESTHAETKLVPLVALQQPVPSQPQIEIPPTPDVQTDEVHTILSSGKQSSQQSIQIDKPPVSQANIPVPEEEAQTYIGRTIAHGPIPQPALIGTSVVTSVIKKPQRDWTLLSIVIVAFLILAALGLVAAVIFTSPTGRAWFSDQFASGESQVSSTALLSSPIPHLTHTPRPTRTASSQAPAAVAPTQAPNLVATKTPQWAATEAPVKTLAQSSNNGSLNPGDYEIILRYEKDTVRQGFSQVQVRLQELGYTVLIDSIYGSIGPIDVIQYGSLECLAMIEKIRGQIGDLLTLPTSEPVRFTTNDTSYEAKVIVIQIVDETLFSEY